MMARISKSTLVFSFLVFLVYGLSFGQVTSGELVFETGSATVCEGSLIQLNLELVGSPFSNFYRWSSTGAYEENDLRPDIIGEDNGGSGNGEEDHSFIRLIIEDPGVTTVTVNIDNVDYSQDITVIEASRAGIGNTLFLCNQTGSINLFDLIDDGDTGGTWTYQDVDDGTTQIDTDGLFEVGADFDNPIDEPNVFTYTVSGTAPCPDSDTTVTIKPCSDDDYDNDSVANSDDDDDDNDGIPNSIENSFCTTTDLTPTQISVDEDFGVGPPTQNRYVSTRLDYSTGIPQDIDTSRNGQYNVATSEYLYNFNNENAFYVATDLNDDNDGDGTQNGRYLAINMLTDSFQTADGTAVIYQQTDLPVTPGAEHILSMKVANLNGGDDQSGQIEPSLRLEIIDNDGNVIEFLETGEIAADDDNWEDFEIPPFTPADGVNVVSLRVLNLQTISGPGNDVGIDNILLSQFGCDFDGDGIPNFLDLDSDNDGIYDAVEAGYPEDVIINGRLAGAVDTSNGISSDAVGAPDTTRFLNYDSDADGCSDANEAYFDREADGGEGEEYGGIPVDPTEIVDLNGRVIAASYTFPEDYDGDDILDFTLAGPLIGATVAACTDIADNDEDGFADEDDLDDDNDGILDTVENGGFDPFASDVAVEDLSDINNDGILDFFDQDLDGIINQFDLDSDGDGIYDYMEADPSRSIVTLDTDETPGQLNNDDDVDGDGVPNDANGIVSSFADGDTLQNFLDLDSDGDGIPDNHEAQATDNYVAPSDTDANNNGVDDAYDSADALTPLVTLDIGDADYINTNSDDDCLINDADEAFDTDQDGESNVTPNGDADDNDGWDTAFQAAFNALGAIAALPNLHNPNTPEVDYREEFEEVDETNPDTVQLCTTLTAYALFDELEDFEPLISGTWSGPSATAEPYDWEIDPSTDDEGVYVYTVTLGTCESTYTVDVEFIEAPFTGDDIEDEICTSVASVVLFDYLSGSDPITENGTWTSDNADAVVPTQFDGEFTISTLSEGTTEVVFTYTVGTGDCETSSTLTLEVIEADSPGTAVASIPPFCIDDDNDYPLIDYLENADPGGTWTNEGAPTSDIFTPSDLMEGDYAFAYTIAATANGCPVASTEFTISIAPELNAGDNAVVSLCRDLRNINLIDYLGATPGSGGTWTSESGAVIFTAGDDQDQGFLDFEDPNTPDSDRYVYTVSSGTTGGCDDAVAFIDLTLTDDRDAGADKNTLICTTETSFFSLFSLLDTPDTDGIWTNTDGITLSDGHVGTLNVDPLASGTYIFNYELPGSGTCQPDDVDVTVEVIRANPPANPTDALICEGDSIPTLSVTVEPGFTANWYNEFDFDGAPLASNTTTFTPPVTQVGGYTYWVRSISTSGGCESDNTIVQFDIRGLPPVTLPSQSFICVDTAGNTLPDNTVSIDADSLVNTPYDFQWYKDNTAIADENATSIVIEEVGSYYIEYTDDNGCTRDSSSTLVTGIVEPNGLELTVAGGNFATEPGIIVNFNADPNSEYEYILDGTISQSTNVFENVEAGFHEVTVVDLVGCGEISGDIFIIGFPKFFTPNGDGFNDSWNVELDPNNPLDLSIFVYDRFGKLVQQVFPEQDGWDGTFAGKNLPSTDYWFKAVLVESSETYTGHFSLIR